MWMKCFFGKLCLIWFMKSSYTYFFCVCRSISLTGKNGIIIVRYSQLSTSINSSDLEEDLSILGYWKTLSNYSERVRTIICPNTLTFKTLINSGLKSILHYQDSYLKHRKSKWKSHTITKLLKTIAKLHYNSKFLFWFPRNLKCLTI